MTKDAATWVRTGKGPSPHVRWCLALEAPLVDLCLCDESGDTIAVDQAGSLYRIDRNGTIVDLSRSFPNTRFLDWSDTGTHGAIASHDTLCWIDQDLQPQWTQTMPAEITDIAVDSHGRYVAVSVKSGSMWIFGGDKRRVVEVETLRPIHQLGFVCLKPQLIAVADQGLACAIDFEGDAVWSQELWMHAGDLSFTGDGSTVLIAGYQHGIQILNEQGEQSGAYVLPGSPHRVSTGFQGQRLAAATVERQVCWLNADGDLIWDATSPDDISRLACEPLADGFRCGLATGHILNLTWED
jgi:hypothetical protein